MSRPWLLAILIGMLSCAPVDDHANTAAAGSQETGNAAQGAGGIPAAADATEIEARALARATFAGGCFWCMESPFEGLAGVRSVISGYSGGTVENPTYRQVCAGGTGHAEAVQIQFDPALTSYEQLLELFWRQIDPTDPGGQFADRGDAYRTEIFYHDEAQKKAAEASRDRLGNIGLFLKPVATRITAFKNFYPAEEYHQDYYQKNASHYERYRQGSGRARFLEATWGKEPAPAGTRQYTKPPHTELRKRLTDLQYRVTQEEATEPPFRNDYWDNKAEGIYVDIVSGEPLFSSAHKFKSGTGWPSFWQPLVETNVSRKTDHHLGYARTEVRSKHANSHLGHVFEDGPKPTGLRYCINSASLMFIPKADLEKSGYGEFRKLFEE